MKKTERQALWFVQTSPEGCNQDGSSSLIAQFFLGLREDLVQSFDSQAIQLFAFCLSFHLAVLLSDRGIIPSILQTPAIWHNNCRSIIVKNW